jgi:hypothetical protein
MIGIAFSVKNVGLVIRWRVSELMSPYFVVDLALCDASTNAVSLTLSS